MKPILSLFSSKILEKSAESCLLRIRDLVKEEGGSNESGSGLEHLEYRCHKRMHKIGLNTLDSYWEMLTTLPGGPAELGKLLQELKCRTPFFSNLSQLDEFRNVVLPRIVEGKKKTGLAHVRIWTVECGTGEDTYSLGMILQEESSRVLDGCTFEVLGTDCDEGAVSFARRALYDAQGMRSVNPHFRQSYFVAAGNQLKISLQIKARVKFELVDLLKDSQMTFIKGMDAIFCCNVLSHLDRPKKQRVLQHFWAALLPHGYLFLGESESLYGASQNFELLDLRSTGVYQKIPQRTL